MYYNDVSIKRYVVLEEISHLESLYNGSSPDIRAVCSERINELYEYLTELNVELL